MYRSAADVCTGSRYLSAASVCLRLQSLRKSDLPHGTQIKTGNARRGERDLWARFISHQKFIHPSQCRILLPLVQSAFCHYEAQAVCQVFIPPGLGVSVVGSRWSILSAFCD